MEIFPWLHQLARKDTLCTAIIKLSQAVSCFSTRRVAKWQLVVVVALVHKARNNHDLGWIMKIQGLKRWAIDFRVLDMDLVD
jgi:hypothetical protein